MTLANRPNGPDMDAEESARPASHVASVAEALVSMGALATSISTRQRVRADQAEEIGRLLPILANRCGVRAAFDWDGEVLSVTFTHDAE